MATELEEDEFGTIDDEDLLLAVTNVEKTNATSAPIANGNSSIATSPNLYRLDFGKHRGKTLDEAPNSYICWILREQIYHDHLGLKAALIIGGHLVDGNFSSANLANENNEELIKAPDPSKPNHKATPEPGAQPYRLNFGQHEGKLLTEVPVSYIRYLTGQKAHESRLDLQGALTELAYSTDSSSEAPDRGYLARGPGDSSFWDAYTGDEIWIATRDVGTFFGITDRDLHSAGVTPLWKSREKRRWKLSAVYFYVQRHRSTRSADCGLKAFLQKNKDCEQKIFNAFSVDETCGDYGLEWY